METLLELEFIEEESFTATGLPKLCTLTCLITA